MLLCSGYSRTGNSDIGLLKVNGHGRFEKVCEYFQGDNPSFIYANEKRFYTCSETERNGTVTEYEYKGNEIKRLKSIQFPGQLVCHILGWENSIITCAYESGTVSVMDQTLTKETTILNTCHKNERKSHAHWSAISPDEKYLLVADLGRDCIWSWSIVHGCFEKVRCIKVKQGCGPRQILFSRNSCYVIGELDNSIHVFEYVGKGDLLYKTSYKVSDSGIPCYTGAAALDGKGRIFIGNRGPDTISVFLIEGSNLIKINEFSCGGCWPRYITTINRGELLLVGNQKSGEIINFDISRENFPMIDRISFPEISCIVPLET